MLLTETNRKPLVNSALRWLAGGPRTKEAVAVLDSLQMLDGDRIDPTRSKYAQEVLNRLNFLDEALDAGTKRVRDAFPCPHCGTQLNKDRLLETRIDPGTGAPWQRVKFRPALISYAVGRVRYEKQPDPDDLAVLARIATLPLPADVPRARFPIEAMYRGSRIAPKGFSHIHHLFLPRAAQAIWGMSVLARYSPTHFSQVNQYLNGVYYVLTYLTADHGNLEAIGTG